MNKKVSPSLTSRPRLRTLSLEQYAGDLFVNASCLNVFLETVMASTMGTPVMVNGTEYVPMTEGSSIAPNAAEQTPISPNISMRTDTGMQTSIEQNGISGGCSQKSTVKETLMLFNSMMTRPRCTKHT
mgnify:CR=1 FL=1